MSPDSCMKYKFINFNSIMIKILIRIPINFEYYCFMLKDRY